MSEQKTLSLFISYSHDDEEYFDVFSSGFSKVIKNARSYNWQIWNDTKIHVGSFWDEDIQKNVNGCDVALLLVSVGFMSSKYIEEKEYNQFVERYRKKGVLIVPIVFAPCDFQAWEDLSKLQFFKPSGREFGHPDIKEFTYADLIKFSEYKGTLIPNPFISRYHLQLTKVIEESYREFERSEVHEAKAPENLDQFQNSLIDFPKPSVLFSSRKSEKQEFLQMFKAFKMFAIDGLGGTGKTQFAAKCIEEFIPNKEKIIWLNGSAQSNFDVFIENSGFGNILKGTEKTDLVLFSGFKDAIEKDEKIIFWDNFNDYNDPAFHKFLSFVYYYLDKSKIILITKTEPDIESITALPIIRLDGLNDNGIEYANKIKSSSNQYSSILDSDIDKICNAVEGHPLAIEFSLSLISRGKKANEIIQHFPELAGIKRGEEFSRRLFLDIFNHPNTSEDERQCFLKCSVFKEKISEEEIKYLCDGNEVFHLIDGLVEKLLFKVRNGFYEIHPLIRSITYEKLENKKETHLKAANYFISQRTSIIFPSQEEKIYYHLAQAEEWELIADSIEKYGKMLLQQGQLNFLTDIIDKLGQVNVWRDIFFVLKGDIAKIKSDWTDALEHFKRASNSGQDMIKAEGIIKNGELMFLQGNLKNSLVLFEQAYNFSHEKKLIKEKARALNDIGLVYAEFSRNELAYQKFSEALKLRKEIGDKEGIATTLNNIGNYYQAQLKFPKALEYYLESIEIANEIEDRINLAIYYMNVANIERQSDRPTEALAANNFALNIFEEMGNQSGISAINNSNGAIYITEKRFDDALECLKTAYKIAHEINDQKNIGSAYHNLGAMYCQSKNYELALFNLYKSIEHYRRLSSKKDEASSKDFVFIIFRALGKDAFTKISNEILSRDKLEIDIREFLNEPYSRINRKISRNDIVKVKYASGETIKAKYKKVENDLSTGECFLVEE
jgi:tetratricopeptide (TPR) repeat protein